jgi:hypothetical protein
MRSAEARSRRPRFKEYTRVRDAQNFAQKLGVGNADYGNRVDIANLVNHALFLAYEQESPLPHAIRVRPFTEQEGDDTADIACYLPGLGNSPGEIEVNSDHFLWSDPVAHMREARDDHEFSTGDPRHPIAHELGELTTHQSLGGDRFFRQGEEYLAAERQFQGEDLDHIYQAVSDKATENHSEFVAEVFAALLLGRDELREDSEVMRLYEKYGGAGVRHGLDR